MPAHALIFMAQPAEPLRQAMLEVVTAMGWVQRLGVNMFPHWNWHQSLSHRVAFSIADRDRMIRAGARVAADAFTLELNRLASLGKAGDRKIHWEFHPTKRPAAFDALLIAVREAMLLEGVAQIESVEDMGSNRPHVTVTYRAPNPLPKPIPIRPIPWRIDELVLVEARKEPHYHYHPLARWPLCAALPGLESQTALF